jgi:Putative beta-barrel porin 2
MRGSPALALALVWIALGVAPARADEDEGRHFYWHPSLHFRTVADDNVFYTSSGAEGDVAFWLQPRMELGYRTGAYELGADVGGDLRRYVEHDSLDQNFLRVKAFGEAGLLPGLSVRVSDALVPQAVTLGQPEDDSGNLLQTNRTEAEVRYWRPFGEDRELSIGAVGTRFLTDAFGEAELPGGQPTPPVAPPVHGDYWEGKAYLEFQHAVGRRSALYVRGLFRYRAFDEFSDSDLFEYSGLLGFRMYWLRSLELDVAGGYGLLDFRTGRNVPRILGQADLRWSPGGGWILHLGAHNRFTADLAGNDFVDTTGRVGLEKHFGTRTVVEVTGFVSYLDNQSLAPRTNLFGGVELGLRRQISRRLQLQAAYRFWVNGGNFTMDDFRQNRLWLGLTYRH